MFAAGILAVSFGAGSLVQKNSIQRTNEVTVQTKQKDTGKEKAEKPANFQAAEALDEAVRIYEEHPAYSQAKRMQEGYVDCSSYVWRCYAKTGIFLGQEEYAPTAAEIARWCQEKGVLQTISGERGRDRMLQPGDLIFYTKRKGNNGRFMNIAHVSIYIGNGKILHADGDSPAYGVPWYRKAAAIGRPSK